MANQLVLWPVLLKDYNVDLALFKGVPAFHALVEVRQPVSPENGLLYPFVFAALRDGLVEECPEMIPIQQRPFSEATLIHVSSYILKSMRIMSAPLRR